MIAVNPFMYITPRNKEDALIGREEFLKKIKETITNSLKEKLIITVNGDFGIGKTFFVKTAVNDLKKRKGLKIYEYDFNFNLLNDLRNLPTEKKLHKEIVVLIDKFELILSLSKDFQEKILELMAELCKSEITMIVTTSDDLLKKVKTINSNIRGYFKVLNVPSLTFEETKKLIVSRLNEVRAEKSNSIEPFTNDEIKQLHKNVKGNPRMILMLCAKLYENKFE